MSTGWRAAAVALGVLVLGAGGTARAQAPPQPPVLPGSPARTSEGARPLALRPLALRLPSSAAILAVGNVGVLSADPEALFYNPGMLPAARGVALSVQRYDASTTSGAFASVHAAGGVTIALGARAVDWSATAFGTEGAVGACPSCPSAGGRVRGESSAYTAGAARVVGPVRVGAAATYARESFGRGVDESALLDVGAVMPFGPGNTGGVAVAVQYVGRGLQLPEPGRAQPWRAVVGVGSRNYPVATFWDISAVSEVAVDADGTLTAGGGAELAWVPVEGLALAFRVGARGRRDDARPLTGGFGLSLDRWSLDYAVEPGATGSVGHRLGVRIR